MAMMIFTNCYSGLSTAMITTGQLPNIPTYLKDLLKINENTSTIPILSTKNTLLKILMDDINIDLLKKSVKEYYQRLYTNIRIVPSENRGNVFFWLTYNIPFHVSRYKMELGRKDHKTELPQPSSEIITMTNGIFALIEYYQERETYQAFADVSDQYERLNHFNLYDENVNLDTSSFTYYSSHKFLGDFVHYYVGQFDNMGLFARWKNQALWNGNSYTKVRNIIKNNLKNNQIKQVASKINLITLKRLEAIFIFYLLASLTIFVIFIIEKIFDIFKNINYSQLIFLIQISISNLFKRVKNIFKICLNTLKLCLRSLV